MRVYTRGSNVMRMSCCKKMAYSRGGMERVLEDDRSDGMRGWEISVPIDMYVLRTKYLGNYTLRS